jgi:tripartite-type tricarboxylate transporter receptor subunit TctC
MTTNTLVASLPDVPTLHKQGLPGSDVWHGVTIYTWTGTSAPAQSRYERGENAECPYLN